MLTSIVYNGFAKCFVTIGVGCVLTLCSVDTTIAAAPVTIKATGTLEPHEVVDVVAPVAGIVRDFGSDPSASKKSITYGSVVKKGTVLARLESDGYELAVVQAEADVRKAEAGLELAKLQTAHAERTLQRAAKLEAEKTGSNSDVESARAAVEVARGKARQQMVAVEQTQIALKRARLNLEHCILRSPIDGIVLDRRVNLGQYVAPNQTSPSLFLIGDLSKLEIWASVAEADIPRVAPGSAVRFTFDAFPNKKFTGRVSQVRLNAMMTQNRVTYTVVIDVDEADTKLLPYLTADVEIDVGEHP